MYVNFLLFGSHSYSFLVAAASVTEVTPPPSLLFHIFGLAGGLKNKRKRNRSKSPKFQENIKGKLLLLLICFFFSPYRVEISFLFLNFPISLLLSFFDFGVKRREKLEVVIHELDI